MPFEVLLEHTRDQYLAEIQRKDSILQRSGISAAILLLEGNLIASLASSYQIIVFERWHLIFYAPFAIGFLLCIVSALQVAFVIYKGGTYTYLPKADEIKLYFDKMRKRDYEDATLRNKLLDNLINVYSFCATHNFKVNTKRNGYIQLSIKIAIASLAFVIISLPGYYFMLKSFPSATTSVEIKNPITIKP